MSSSKISVRQNNHFDQNTQSERNSKVPLVHVFAQSEKSSLLAEMQQQLKRNSYEYRRHTDMQELKPTVEAPLRKIFVVVCLDGGKDLVLNGFKIGSSKMVKFCTLGGQGTNYKEQPSFQKAQEVIRAIKDFSADYPSTIRLSSVHSIRLSIDKKVASSRDLRQVATDANYQRAFYFKNYRGEYVPDEDPTYNNFIQLLEKAGSFQPFKSVRDLQKLQAPIRKKKYLILASTNAASLQVIQELKKAKLQHFHFILLGMVKPKSQFLDKEVILVSNDARAHVEFLQNNGFASPVLQKISDRLALQPLQPNQNIGKVQDVKETPAFDYYQSSASKIVNLESQKVGQQEPQKKKIRKIKSPVKSKQSQINHIQLQHDQSQTNINNVNIVISKHEDEPIIQNQQFRTNKQGERIYKKESIKEVKQQKQVPNYSNATNNNNYFDARIQKFSNHNPSSRFDSIPPLIESQFAAKKPSNIDSKYRNPSVIIQEMSDQYRGSNKQSIMNLEPQKTKAEQAQFPIEPIEQNPGKRVITKGSSYSSNQPQTHYVSNRTIQYTRTNQTISDPNININKNQTLNNIPKYVLPSSPRVISATPMTITSANSSNSRVYGGYQSPRRVIRKDAIVPEQIVENEPKKQKQENRLTFGSNFNQNFNNNLISNSNNNTFNNSNSNNTLNYSNSNQNFTISSSYRNPQQHTTTNNILTSSYYTPQTFNYHTLHNQPYSSKIQISPGRVENVVTSTMQKAEQVKANVAAHLEPPKADEKSTKQFVFNYDDYQQIQRDGRIVYRKKMPVDGTKYTPINYVSPSVKVEKEEEGSPVVKRYETSPLRRQVQSATYQLNKVTPLTTTYDYNKARPQITTYDYNRGNSPQVINYDYNQIGNGNNYNNYNSKNYEVITVPYKADEHNLGEMIESSHKKKNAENIQNTQNNRAVDSKNFVSVSYRNEDRSSANNFQDTGVRVYGVSHPRVEVERIEQIAPKVESINPLSVKTPLKPKPELSAKANKTKIDLKGDISPVQAQKNALNESNWFSRMSELHSDGSILRRNNIRFGVKLNRRQQKQETNNSVVQNKLISGIFKVNDLNKKMALNRIIQGEEYIQEERQKYAHVNPSLNRFHLLLQQDLEYLLPALKNYLFRPHDHIDTFAGVNSLFTNLAPHSEIFDIGFVFARQNEMALINPSLLPQNYYLVSIYGEEGLLQISEAQKRVRINHLRHFPLVQRIIIDSQLYQYVAYRNSRPEVELLADKFVNSQFILEKIETEFTTQILDCYYYELPRLTRLYVLCDESQLPGLLAIVHSYIEVNPGFKIETCKLVCVLSNILGNQQLIMAHPTVTFISNPEQITHFKHILGYAHYYDAPDPHFLPIDHLFYHSKHTGLEQQLAAYYPGKFTAYPFGKVAEVYNKVEKLSKNAGKYGHHPKIYLVLHESVNAEKVRVEYFSKIFMLGKAKVVQNKVVRVMNTEELLELLKK